MGGQLRIDIDRRYIRSGKTCGFAHRCQDHEEVDQEVGRTTEGERRDDESGLRAMRHGFLDDRCESGQTVVVAKRGGIPAGSVAVGRLQDDDTGVGRRQEASG